MTVRASIRSRFRMLWVAPLLAVLALGAWAFASPVGSSPDDDYHLVSIWCAAGERTSLCEPSDDPTTRMVSPQLLDLNCYARDEDESAACQTEVLEETGLVESARGNFVGAYPPVYYGVMSLFASDDIIASALVMRFVNILLYVGLSTALFALLPLRRRPALVWGWLASIVPLGVFLIASNNPSAWAVIGIGTLALSLLGWFETEGRRRWALGGVAVLATVLAAGSRGDAAVYAVLVAGAVAVLAFERRRTFWMRAILVGVVAVAALAFLLVSSQIMSGFTGFGSSPAAAPAAGPGFAVGAEEPEHSTLGLLFSNLVNVPVLWGGVFGFWSLGWFDTPMPSIVGFGGVAVYVAVCFTGIADLAWRKLIVVASTMIGIWVIPVFTLTRGGDQVGVEVQPRYILPLIIVLAMFCLVTTGDRLRWFTRVQTILLGTTLTGTFSIALYFDLRRYLTGNDAQGIDLGDGLEWWWASGVPGPMVVLFVGALAWAGLVAVLLTHLHRLRPLTAPEAVDAPVASAR